MADTDEIFIETPWETRNLGISSYALNLQALGIGSAEDSGTVRLALQELNSRHSSYFIFARIPREQLSSVALLERSGFSVVECTVVPFIRLQNHELLNSFEQDPARFLPSKYQKAELAFCVAGNPDTALAETIKRVASESFVDDRIHVDHNCPKEIADRRFAYWVDDLVANPEVCFDLLTINHEVAGFMARKQNNLVLAGFSKTYRQAGLGEYLWLSSCREIRNSSYKTAETLISINNVAVLNLYARLGFRFKDTCYSLHYWGGERIVEKQ